MNRGSTPPKYPYPSPQTFSFFFLISFFLKFSRTLGLTQAARKFNWIWIKYGMLAVPKIWKQSFREWPIGCPRNESKISEIGQMDKDFFFVNHFFFPVSILFLLLANKYILRLCNSFLELKINKLWRGKCLSRNID